MPSSVKVKVETRTNAPLAKRGLIGVDLHRSRPLWIKYKSGDLLDGEGRLCLNDIETGAELKMLFQLLSAVKPRTNENFNGHSHE